jgi:putative transposase
MRWFGSVASASRFFCAFDEVRQFFRARTTMKQKVSLVHQRDLFRQRLEALMALELVA